MLKSPSTSLIVRGILALAVGAIALAWPGVTVLALVILFAVYAFIAAGLQAARAFSSPGARPRPGSMPGRSRRGPRPRIPPAGRSPEHGGGFLRYVKTGSRRRTGWPAQARLSGSRDDGRGWSGLVWRGRDCGEDWLTRGNAHSNRKGFRQMGAAWMALGVIDVHDDLQVTG